MLKSKKLQELLDEIALHVYMNSGYCHHMGLSGKAGTAVFLSNYAVTGDPLFARETTALIDELDSEMVKLEDTSLANGICGIASALDYLYEHHSLGERGPYMIAKLHRKPFRITANHLDYHIGFIGQGIYWANRMPVMDVQRVKRVEDLAIYDQLLNISLVVEGMQRQYYEYLIGKMQLTGFDAVKEFGFEEYVKLVFNISKLVKLFDIFQQKRLGVALCGLLMQKLIALGGEILNSAMRLNWTDLIETPQVGKKSPLILLNVLIELEMNLQDVLPKEAETRPYIGVLMEASSKALTGSIVPDLQDVMDAISLVMRVKDRYNQPTVVAWETQLWGYACAALTDNGMLAVNALPSLAKDPNIGVLNGWSKVGLLLKAHLHPDDLRCRAAISIFN
jgi:hypothetical protein